MSSTTLTTEIYIDQVPAERKEAFLKLRKTLLKNLPKGFSEGMQYGMIGYFVPHKLYPKGYHTNPKEPLPFINLGSKKNYIALHHMGLYGNKKLLDWFVTEYPKHSKTKLDMGKGCIRFKKPEHIPFDLIAELATKVTPQQWITWYEQAFTKK